MRQLGPRFHVEFEIYPLFIERSAVIYEHRNLRTCVRSADEGRYRLALNQSSYMHCLTELWTRRWDVIFLPLFSTVVPDHGIS